MSAPSSPPVWRRSNEHSGGRIVILVGMVLMVLGAPAGWGALVLRWLGISVPGMDQLLTPLSKLQSVNVNAFLGADLTALAVIIALVIGFNASLLQVAGRSVSLALTRAILYSIRPYLVCWGFTSGVGLAYEFYPPIYFGQILQLFIWFAAIVLLMLGYLWTIPWRLSGEYAAFWALRNLHRQSIAQWEMLEGYSVLQTSFNSAVALGDLGAARALALEVGAFLVLSVDPKAEGENRYTNERFRALKNLVTGFAQNVAMASNAIAYYLGILCSATLLQGVAVRAGLDDKNRALFSGVLRALRNSPERLDPLWSGIRHALCKPDIQGKPYLIRYWQARTKWDNSDSRLVDDIAEVTIRLCVAIGMMGQRHQGQRNALLSQQSVPAGESRQLSIDDSEIDEEKLDLTAMILALYRNVCKDLGQYTNTLDEQDVVRTQQYPLRLLDALHTCALRQMQHYADQGLRLNDLQQAYDDARSALVKMFEAS